MVRVMDFVSARVAGKGPGSGPWHNNTNTNTNTCARANAWKFFAVDGFGLTSCHILCFFLPSVGQFLVMAKGITGCAASFLFRGSRRRHCQYHHRFLSPASWTLPRSSHQGDPAGAANRKLLIPENPRWKYQHEIEPTIAPSIHHLAHTQHEGPFFHWCLAADQVWLSGRAKLFSTAKGNISGNTPNTLERNWPEITQVPSSPGVFTAAPWVSRASATLFLLALTASNRGEPDVLLTSSLGFQWDHISRNIMIRVMTMFYLHFQQSKTIILVAFCIRLYIDNMEDVPFNQVTWSQAQSNQTRMSKDIQYWNHLSFKVRSQSGLEAHSLPAKPRPTHRCNGPRWRCNKHPTRRCHPCPCGWHPHHASWGLEQPHNEPTASEFAMYLGNLSLISALAVEVWGQFCTGISKKLPVCRVELPTTGLFCHQCQLHPVLLPQQASIGRTKKYPAKLSPGPFSSHRWRLTLHTYLFLASYYVLCTATVAWALEARSWPNPGSPRSSLSFTLFSSLGKSD